MCVAFCGSLGLAEWVVHDQRTKGGTPLERVPISVGPLSIRGPRGWELESQSEHPVRYVAVEPERGDRDARTLTIRETKVQVGTSAEKFLAQKGLEFGLPSEPIRIGKVNGILVSSQSQADTEMAPESAPIVNEWIAGCVGPNGIAISIQLKGPEETETQRMLDKQLIRDVARAIAVQDDPGNR